MSSEENSVRRALAASAMAAALFLFAPKPAGLHFSCHSWGKSK